jgi:hypothetical protein
VLGQLVLHSALTGPIVTRDGQLLASGTLAHALSNQLASDQAPGAPVSIGVSFRSKSGDYCRTFVLHEEGGLAGLACRDHDDWRLQVVAQSPAEAGANGQYRPAGSAIPGAVRQAVDEQISGDPLDAHGETAARDKDWSR